MEVKDEYVRYMVFKLAENKDISVERIAEILNIPREEARKFWFNYYNSDEYKDLSCHFIHESNKHDSFWGVQHGE